MTDLSADMPPSFKQKPLTISDQRTRARNAAEKRFRLYGVAAITAGLVFLILLVFSIISNGLPAFKKTVIAIDFKLTTEQFETAEAALLKTRVYSDYFTQTLTHIITNSELNLEINSRSIERIIGKVGGTLRQFYRENRNMLNQPVHFDLPAASRIDRYFKGTFSRDGITKENRFIQVEDLDLVDALAEVGIIQQVFNWQFITGVDTGVDNPGGAGIGAAVLGSFMMMIVVLLLSLPIGVAASIYLQEFAPKNWFTDFIEVNISNLAAVPSIVFGILGLAIFIQFMHLPQSAPLVGGLVLTLMTLPTIIISTRASLRAVPPSIRDAALAVGASKMQAVFHHVLPLAMPGILTGTIIGLAQALGETAPLLLIGMVGFVARYPDSILGGFEGPNSALPAQIFNWASRSDAVFVEKAWGGIIILLIFLLSMNIVAVLLRRRFERRW
ncbi:MAG: phosphate ABC transporter permease PstA [Aestuariivita sp.]|nr:phosphate ABC transporter permease PstA [Aestuariivita sp.]